MDSRRTTGIYFASDSRRSFSETSYFDDCIKLFAPQTSPDIFAMLGQDISFPRDALPKICEEIDAGNIPPGSAIAMAGRIDWVINRLRLMKTNKLGGGNFTVFHGSRNFFSMGAFFSIAQHRFIAEDEAWQSNELDLEARESCAVTFDGSGCEFVSEQVTLHGRKLGSVSRINFAGLCTALKNQKDPLSGGAPQLLGLGSTGNGRHYGVLMPFGAFFQGCFVSPNDVSEEIQWRDTSFEPVDRSGNSIRNRRRKVLRGRK